MVPDEIRYWYATKGKIGRALEVGVDALTGKTAVPGELRTITKNEVSLCLGNLHKTSDMRIFIDPVNSGIAQEKLAYPFTGSSRSVFVGFINLKNLILFKLACLPPLIVRKFKYLGPIIKQRRRTNR